MSFNGWHEKCGHISTHYLKRLGVKTLSKLPDKIRCEECMRGKIHKFAHKELHTLEKEKYLPGECIHTDLMGPYARGLFGERYAQLFKDVGSSFCWVHAMSHKTGSDENIKKVILDSKARSGRDLRFLKTDGDGIFSSKTFVELTEKFRFIHAMSAPHDHNTNAHIEREIRTIFEGTATLLAASGAPSTFWPEAQQHFVFTRNVLPTVEIQESGGKAFKSPAKPSGPERCTVQLAMAGGIRDSLCMLYPLSQPLFVVADQVRSYPTLRATIFILAIMTTKTIMVLQEIPLVYLLDAREDWERWKKAVKEAAVAWNFREWLTTVKVGSDEHKAFLKKIWQIKKSWRCEERRRGKGEGAGFDLKEMVILMALMA